MTIDCDMVFWVESDRLLFCKVVLLDILNVHNKKKYVFAYGKGTQTVYFNKNVNCHKDFKCFEKCTRKMSLL